MIEQVNQTNISEVIAKSANTTVLLYIFDPKDPNTEALKQTLENSVGADNEFLNLAEANAEDPVIQSVCMQIGIQSLPAICVLSGGRPTDLITSDRLSDLNNIKGLISSYLPPKEKILFSEAVKLEEEGKNNEAYLKLKEANEIAPNDINIKFALISISIKNKKIKESKELLNSIDPANQQTQVYKDLLAALTLAEQNQKNPETEVLKAKHNENPDDLDIVEKLATALNQEGENEEALELLLSYLKKDLNAGNIKKTYLDIIATLNGDPLQAKYRRALYTLMY